MDTWLYGHLVVWILGCMWTFSWLYGLYGAWISIFVLNTNRVQNMFIISTRVNFLKFSANFFASKNLYIFMFIHDQVMQTRFVMSRNQLFRVD